MNGSVILVLSSKDTNIAPNPTQNSCKTLRLHCKGPIFCSYDIFMKKMAPKADEAKSIKLILSDGFFPSAVCACESNIVMKAPQIASIVPASSPRRILFPAKKLPISIKVQPKLLKMNACD